MWKQGKREEKEGAKERVGKDQESTRERMNGLVTEEESRRKTSKDAISSLGKEDTNHRCEAEVDVDVAVAGGKQRGSHGPQLPERRQKLKHSSVWSGPGDPDIYLSLTSGLYSCIHD